MNQVSATTFAAGILSPLPKNPHLPPKPSSTKIAATSLSSKNQTNAFRNKVNTSNQNTICQASNTKVGRSSMQEIIKETSYRVPIFQRRYCWTKIQWDTILNDAINSVTSHSLGRLTCTSSEGKDNSSESKENSSEERRSIILDGQQRFTTITILLSCLRDAYLERNENLDQVKKINKLLFTDIIKLDQYLSQIVGIAEREKQISEVLLKDGIELSFARLIPTFCDRLAYFLAILPLTSTQRLNTMACLNISIDKEEKHHIPLEAKFYFMKKLQKYSLMQMKSLQNAILKKFTMLYFPIQLSGNRTDGTEDVMIIYERLAIRDATFCKPGRSQEYVSMDGSDMIRNLLLGSFSTTEKALEFYTTYWLALERKFDFDLKNILQLFLNTQNPTLKENELGKKGKKGGVSAGIIGGTIYAEFQTWLDNFINLQDKEKEDNGRNGKDFENHEDIIMKVGQKITDFASCLEDR